MSNEEIKPLNVIVRKEQLIDDNGSSRVGYDKRLIPPDQLSNETRYYKLFDFFNLGVEDRASDKKSNMLKLINDWAEKDAGSKETDKIIRSIINLEQKLGSPPIGFDRIDHLYNFAKIQLTIDDMENQRDEMYKRRIYL